MAIRIVEGTRQPKNRITMPLGTYLSTPPKFSNPATAAAGYLSGGAGETPPQIPLVNNFVGVTGGGKAPTFQKSIKGMLHFGTWNPEAYNTPLAYQSQPFPAKPYLQPRGAYGQTISPTGLELNNPVIRPRNVFGQPLDLSRPPTPVNAFKEPQHSLVGQDVGSSPDAISMDTAQNVFSGLPQSAVIQAMANKGYSWNGQGFIKTHVVNPESNTVLPTPTSLNGRPDYIDPSALAPGERVTTASGATFVGGTPTAEGKAQYSVTIPGGQSDERYKWESSVHQDQYGNYVRVYRRVLRAQYTRKFRRERYARRLEQQHAAVSPTVNAPVETQQLVNFRANFG